MATSSWRLDDLHQLEELGLAGQLESTRLYEKGSGVDEFNLRGYNSEQDDLNTVLSDLLMAPADPPSLPSMQPLAEVILLAPTAYVLKQASPGVTYINRGQWYEIRLRSCLGQQDPAVKYKCCMTMGFSELRMKNNEQELLDCWSREHPCERLLDIDRRGCDGVSDVTESEALNSFSFVWQSSCHAIISIKINSLSSEFSPKKHGGEKGVILQFTADLYDTVTDSHLQRCACNVKVFKDKGGDRKHKQDQLKVEKMSPNERCKYQMSNDVTTFSSVSMPTVLPTGNSPEVPYTRICGEVMGTQLCSPISTHLPQSPQSTRKAPYTLDVGCSIGDVHLWLSAHHFSPYLSQFSNYNGADLLRLSRQDLVELCGSADGIRLFNALHSQSLCTVYVCLEDQTVYQALSLEELTAQEFTIKLARKMGLQPGQVSSVLQIANTGILVFVDDTVVRNFSNEDSFVVSAVKDEPSSFKLLLRRPNISSPTTSLLDSILVPSSTGNKS